MKDVLAILGALLAGGVAAGAVVYLAARRTQADLSGQGADMQAAFEAAGRLTEQQLQAQADAYARDIARMGQAKIAAVAQSTAQQVVWDYGITPAFIADVQAVQQAYATARTNPFAYVMSRLS